MGWGENWFPEGLVPAPSCPPKSSGGHGLNWAPCPVPSWSSHFEGAARVAGVGAPYIIQDEGGAN